MTADLSEGETELRPEQTTSEANLKVDLQPGRFSDRYGLKCGHWKDAGRNTGDSRICLGDVSDGNHFRGATDLTVWFRNCSSSRPEPIQHGQDVTDQGNREIGKQMPPGRFMKAEVFSPEGDGNEGTEDDFEDGNGVVVKVTSDVAQEVSQRSRDLNQNLHAKELHQPLPAAHPSTTSPGWESVLPQKNIKVLLAEDDDSTRQVVGALLRNCSYEVSSVSNGMQAWEMLEDSNNHFDLVLTDVVMPCLSGVGLLTKIMSNDAGKRIPVIMMSSHDSLDIVFRCLSKGAADFLVKPVRKNELKNLWQHVWRCQSSSGSGSGSGAGGSGSGSGDGKVGRTKSHVGLGNNTGSCDGSDDNSSGLNVWGGSDNGSGTHVAAHPNHKLKKDKAEAEEGQVTSFEKLPCQQMGQDLAMATPRSNSLEADGLSHRTEHNASEPVHEQLPSTSGNSGNKLEKECSYGGTNSGGSSANAVDLIGGIAYQKSEDEGLMSDDMVEGLEKSLSKNPTSDKCVTSSNSLPLLELSLKRSRPIEHDDNNEKRVLRHSGGSAFSRYSTNGTTIQQIHVISPHYFMEHPLRNSYGTHTPTLAGASLHFSNPSDRVGSSKGLGETTPTLQVQSRTSLKDYGQDVGSSMVGSSTPDGHSHQCKDEAVSVSPSATKGHPKPRPLPPQGLIYDGVSAAYRPGMHQVFYTHSPTQWANGATQLSEKEAFDHASYHEHAPLPPFHPSRQSQAHHHSCLSQPFQYSQQGDEVLTNQGSGAPLCSSSNLVGSLPEGNIGQTGSSNGHANIGNGNGSVNGSGSGSNNQNGQSYSAVNATTPNGDSGGNLTGNGAAECNGGVAGPEQNRHARREAALHKFRQKRKERCFEKKVRYQSRKRLAEQRPRVRGQFVRQSVYNSNVGSEMVD